MLLSDTKKIFGVGLSRTGTTLLNSVLLQLGFDSRHYVGELLGKADWSVLEKHDAFCDLPIPMLFEECDKRCPGSRFILTTRSIDRWLQSMEWLLTEGRVLWNFSNSANGHIKEFYGDVTFNPITLTNAWEKHHENVRSYFANRPNDLFVINLEDGFDTLALCDFLGLPATDIDLAQKNAKGQRASTFQKAWYYGPLGVKRWLGRLARPSSK